LDLLNAEFVVRNVRRVCSSKTNVPVPMIPIRGRRLLNGR
jgi:hypothetical protein